MRSDRRSAGSKLTGSPGRKRPKWSRSRVSCSVGGEGVLVFGNASEARPLGADGVSDLQERRGARGGDLDLGSAC